MALGCLLWLPALALAQPPSQLAVVEPPGPADPLPPGSASGGMEHTSAAEPAPEIPAPEAGSPSRSVGSPDRGRLEDSAALEETPYLFVRHSRRPALYGTAELVGLVQRSAQAVWTAFEGPKLVVGDLSGPRGGRLSPHRSHRSGRDVDIGFFLLDDAGNPAQAPFFVRLRRDGCGHIRDQRYCIDPARSWALLSAIVQDPLAQVQYVLVAPDIRNRVLAEGRRQGASAELIDRVSVVTEPHAGSHSHRSHFHVRIYCPVDDRPSCHDEPPFHEWYEGEPAPPGPAVRRVRQRQRRAAQTRAERRDRARAARARTQRERSAAEREQRRDARARRRGRTDVH